MAIVNKLKKGKKFKKKAKNDGSIAKKENSHKLELPTPVNFTRKLNGSLCNKRFRKDISDAAIHGKNPSLKCLSTQKKFKLIQTSKLIAKHQKPVFPVRSILKNHAKVFSGLNSAICNLQDGSQVDVLQRSDRHVRFSGKDDILGPRKNKISDALEHSIGNPFSDAFAASSEEDQSTKSNKEVAPMEVDGSDDDVSVSTDNGTEVQPITGKKQLLNTHDHVDMPCFVRPHVSCQDKIKHFPEKSVSLSPVSNRDDNLHMFDQRCPTVSHKHVYAGIPRLLSALEERNNPCVNAQLGGNISRAFNNSGKSIDHFVDSVHGVAAMSSMAKTRASSQPSSSCFVLDENTNRRPPFLSQSATENINGCTLQYQPFCHASPMELMNSICPFPEWKQRAVPFRERRMDEGFLGLPLNSQGELIQLSSSGKGGLDQLREPSMITGSSSSLPAYNLFLPQSNEDYLGLKKRHFVDTELPKDQLNLFPVQNFVKESPKVHVPARFGVTESEGTGTADVQWLNAERGINHSVRLLDSDLNLSSIHFNHSGNGIIRPKENSDQILLNSNQPTMRLMGKDVAVGRSSNEMQGVEDGKVWTDKEIITEHIHTSSGPDHSSMKINFLQDWILHPASGKSKETMVQSLEIQSNHVSQSNLLMKAPEYKFSNPFLNWPTNVVHQNGSLTINENPSNKVHSFFHSPASSAVFNGAPSFQEPFISRAESVRVSSQLPLLSSPHMTCQHMHWSPVELNHKQNLPHATKSAFNFPFLHPDCRENVQSSWFQSSSKSLPPWLLHAQQDNPLISSSQPFSDMGSRYFHQPLSGTNFCPTPPVHNLPEVSYPYNPMNSQSHMKNSLGPASVLHPPHVPVIPGVKPSSTINIGYRNRFKFKDRMKSKAFGIKDPHPCKKTKRPAAKADGSTKPTRILNLEMQEDLSAVTGLTRENFTREIQRNAGMLELDPNRDKASGVGSYPNESLKDGLRTSPGIDSSKVDGMARSGPVKLSAGAKHILKPSQAVDQDNSKLIYSTVPFAAATNCSREPESQKKLTKIYRF